MKVFIIFAFLLNFIVPLKVVAQYTTHYLYDESGNVTSRRNIGYASHRPAKNVSVADTASFADIYYNSNNCTLTIKLNHIAQGATTIANIFNATTRLRVSSFSFDGAICTHGMSAYPQGIYIIEAICGEQSTTKKITR